MSANEDKNAISIYGTMVENRFIQRSLHLPVGKRAIQINGSHIDGILCRMAGIVTSRHNDLGVIDRHSMTVTRCRQVCHFINGGNLSTRINRQAIYLIRYGVHIIYIGTANQIDIAHNKNSTTAPHRLWKREFQCLPRAYIAIRTELGGVNLIANAFAITSTNDIEMGLRSYNGHVFQGYR